MPKSQRKSQTFVPGLGQHYASPKKAAPRRATFVRPLGHDDVTLCQVNEIVPRWSWTTASSCTWSFVDFGIIGIEEILSEGYG